MLPMHSDLIANLVLEERRAHAATQRRVRAYRRTQPDLPSRVGAHLVRLGTRLQARGRVAPRAITDC